MKYFIIFLLGVISISFWFSGIAYALLEGKTDDQLYNGHDVILIGKIIKAEGRLSERITDYTVSAEKYLKDDLGEQLQLFANGKKDSNLWIEDETIFGVGDRVLLYLIKDESSYNISPYSHVLDQGTGEITSKKSDYSVATIEFDSAQYFTKKMIQCFDVEELCKYRPQKDQKIVTITVTDPDSNIFNESIDRVNIFVWSDSDPKGIVITAHETHVNSGVFVEKILIADDVSGTARIRVSDGDTLSAKYIDETLPASHDSDSLEVSASSMIGLLGYPFERVASQNTHFLNNKGDKISSSKIGDQIQIVSELQNLSFHKQSFAYLVQIKNQDDVGVSLSWINGIMIPKQNLKPFLSWIPPEPDTYTITIFVWESVDNPTALSPTNELEITVNNK